MNDISPKERLFRVLEKKSVDRPPVICPGGMMNSATVDVMDESQLFFPDVHKSALAMEKLSSTVQQRTGFENFGIPYCMTVEAEVLGSSIDFGTRECEPKINNERYAASHDIIEEDPKTLIKKGRIEAIAKAGYEISVKNPDIPVIGSLTGPISTAASVVDPLRFLKELRKDKENAHRALTYVTDFLIEYARVLIDSGFSVITIADPTATGEILGPAMFNNYAIPYINKLADAIHAMNTPVIVHICGRLESVKKYLGTIRGDAISTDAMVNLADIRNSCNGITVMGNMSTFALQLQTPSVIQRVTEKLLRDKINIISPACGLSTTTPIMNIQAMTETVKNSI
ncbi:MAG: hypothetical protein IJ056_01220 [Acidaminococcaceae bacterium]|nr:hypothetical protein [Acidaminococcaceae bacterium]MBQ9635820.1 hypothetical protein [Acidaminococcaceae bacterium]MBQ9698731.1 hypothetical protein [Acidaminococcaceae bacterium]MBR1591198.1 hypothetical protein [Acidaminococcaceae bacterium]